MLEPLGAAFNGVVIWFVSKSDKRPAMSCHVLARHKIAAWDEAEIEWLWKPYLDTAGDLDSA